MVRTNQVIYFEIFLSLVRFVRKFSNFIGLLYYACNVKNSKI